MGVGPGWIIITLALVVVVALLALVVALITRASGAPTVVLDESDDARLRPWLTNLRAVESSALVLGVLALVITLMAGLVLHRASLLALAGAVAALTSLVVLLRTIPAPAGQDEVRQASLQPRSPWTFGPRWAFIVPVVITVLVVAIAWVQAALAGRGSQGEWGYAYLRDSGATIEAGKVTEIWREPAVAGPWLGWPAALVVTVVSLGVLGLMVVVLNRIATDASLGDAGLSAADARVRALRTRMVVMATSAWLAVQAATVVLLPGVALSGLEELAPNASDFVLVPRQPHVAIGVGLVRGSGAFLLLALALAVMSSVAIVRLKRNG